MNRSNIAAYEMQKIREQLFPKDRIAFYNSQTAVREDIATFKYYAEGAITLQMACERIRKHNYLTRVTTEQFLNEYRICGYDKFYNLEKEEEFRKMKEGGKSYVESIDGKLGGAFYG